MSKSQQVLETLGRTEYNRWYNKGWRHSQTDNASLDNQPAGDAIGWAWEDGYMDYAGDRDKFHRRDCLLDDHNDCHTN
jgi:hypothetical protein